MGRARRACWRSASRSPGRWAPNGISVTAVAPGFTETEMAAEALAELASGTVLDINGASHLRL